MVRAVLSGVFFVATPGSADVPYVPGRTRVRERVDGIEGPAAARPVEPRAASGDALAAHPELGDSVPPRSSPAYASLAYGQVQRSSERVRALVAQQIMSAPVMTLLDDVPIGDAREAFRRKGVRHFPIVSAEGALVGMLSERDVLRHATSVAAPGAAGGVVRDVMTPRVLVTTPTTEIREIARVLLEERIGALPILGTDQRILGIVTRGDLLRAIVTRAPLELWI